MSFISNPTLFFSGALTLADLVVLETTPVLCLDFSDADIENGATMGKLVSFLKKALATGKSVTLYGPPQLLVHNLYRVGFYPHPLLIVENLRLDEPYG